MSWSGPRPPGDPSPPYRGLNEKGKAIFGKGRKGSVAVPPGKYGKYRIERFKVTKDMAQQKLANSNIGPYSKPIPAGTYTRLVEGSNIIMTDIPAEYKTKKDFLRNAKGHILIVGLGLGVTIDELMKKKGVRSITAIEYDRDIAKGVGNYYKKKYPGRFKAFVGDGFNWIPPKGTHFDTAWYGIWGDVSPQITTDMAKLRKHYAPFMSHHSWSSGWMEREAKKMTQLQNNGKGVRSLSDTENIKKLLART